MINQQLDYQKNLTSSLGYLEPHKMVLYYKNPDIGITFEGETQYFEDSSGNYERIEKRIRF